MNNSMYFSSSSIDGFSMNATRERSAARRATECALCASERISGSLSDGIKFGVNFETTNCVALIENASFISRILSLMMYLRRDSNISFGAGFLPHFLRSGTMVRGVISSLKIPNDASAAASSEMKRPWMSFNWSSFCSVALITKM